MKVVGWFSVSVAGVALAAAPALDAQVMALSPTTMIGYAGTTAAGTQARQQIGARLAAPRGRVALPAGASIAQVAARTSYRPDPAVRQQVYARTVAQVQKTSPADAAKMKQLLMSGKILDEVAGFLASNGMSANSLVDTTALYLGYAWIAAQGRNDDPTAAQLKGLRGQVARTFATMPALLGASNALKQEVGEANIIQASLSSALANRMVQDPKIAGQARAAVVRGVKSTYQIDLSRMDLTAEGLR